MGYVACTNCKGFARNVRIGVTRSPPVSTLLRGPPGRSSREGYLTHLEPSRYHPQTDVGVRCGVFGDSHAICLRGQEELRSCWSAMYFMDAPDMHFWTQGVRYTPSTFFSSIVGAW